MNTNSITLSGRIVNDPEIGDGRSPDKFRLAFDRKKGEEYVSAFIQVAGWFHPDDIEQFSKGDLVVVVGEMDFYTIPAKDGERYPTTVYTVLAREIGQAAKMRPRGESDSGGRSASRSKSSSRNTGRSSSRSSRPADDEDEPF